MCTHFFSIYWFFVPSRNTVVHNQCDYCHTSCRLWTLLTKCFILSTGYSFLFIIILTVVSIYSTFFATTQRGMAFHVARSVEHATTQASYMTLLNIVSKAIQVNRHRCVFTSSVLLFFLSFFLSNSFSSCYRYSLYGNST